MSQRRKPLEFRACSVVVLCDHMQLNPSGLLGFLTPRGMNAPATKGLPGVKPLLGIIFALSFAGQRLSHDLQRAAARHKVCRGMTNARALNQAPTQASWPKGSKTPRLPTTTTRMVGTLPPDLPPSVMRDHA